MRTGLGEAEVFWWIVLAVVVVGFAVAWWTSGRAKGRRSPITDAHDAADTNAYAAQHEAIRASIRGPNGPQGF